MADLLIKTRFLIPLADNAGVAFTDVHFDTLRDRIFDAGLGGFTRLANDTEGWWRAADGRLYFDQCHQYQLGLESLRDIATLLELIDWAKVYFRQEAIYVEVAAAVEIL